MKKEHISLLSSTDLDVQKEETSVDLTSTHLLRVELKTKVGSGSSAAFSRPIRPIINFSELQMAQLLVQIGPGVSPQPSTPLKNEP